jgi:hypothetical protein
MEVSKRILLMVLAAMSPIFAFCQGLDERINDAFDPYATAWENLVFTSIPIGGSMSVPIVLIVLVVGATFFTIYFGFVNIRKFPLAIRVVRGKYDELEGAKKPLKASVREEDGDLVDTIKIEPVGNTVTRNLSLSGCQDRPARVSKFILSTGMMLMSFSSVGKVTREINGRSPSLSTKAK